MANIGIDIGTSYSSVCILDGNKQPERVKVATGTGMFGDAYSLPSAVFVETDGRLLVGQAAMANRMRIPENFKSEFKRDLGQQAPYLLGDSILLPEDLYKEFFIYLKHCVEEYTHERVTQAAVTCPAVFNQNKKELIRSAAKKAGLLEVDLLDEPSAAAFCYLNAGRLKEGDTLLVYDLGGGTFDVALLRLSGGNFHQLTQPQGLAACGGADFDKLIFDHILEQIGEERLEPVRANPVFFRKFATQIMETAVKAKHHLSGADTFTDVIPVGYDVVEYMLTRDGYNAMIGSIVDETLFQVRTILKNAGITAPEVSNVLLVGGASRTPLVRERLAQLMGKEPLKDIDPELAVCAGASVMGMARAKADELRQKEEEERRLELARLATAVRQVLEARKTKDARKEEDERRVELARLATAVRQVLEARKTKDARKEDERRVELARLATVVRQVLGARKAVDTPRELGMEKTILKTDGTDVLWDEKKRLCEDRYRVQKGKLFGLIDEQGHIIAEPQWESMTDFKEGLLIVKKNRTYGYIDINGTVVIPLKWEYAHEFSEGVAAVKINDKFGFVDKEGKIVIPFEWDEAYWFRNGKARAVKNKWHYDIIKQGSGFTIYIYSIREQLAEKIGDISFGIGI